MPYLIAFLFLLSSPLAQAQIFGPVAVPAKERSRDRDTSLTKPDVFGLELGGGANFTIGRASRRDFDQSKGVALRPAPFAGINLVLLPGEPVAFALGMEYVWDRGRIKNYVTTSSDFSSEFSVEPERKREGSVRINEHFLRLRGEMRFNIGKVSISPGAQISRYLGGSQLYEYVQTTQIFSDPHTGTVFVLPEPSVHAGKGIFPDHNFGGYVGLLLGLGYRVNPKLALRLDFDLGIHGRRYNITEVRQNRSRANVGVQYLLLPQSR